jgi:excisionase family DNA binding protein
MHDRDADGAAQDSLKSAESERLTMDVADAAPLLGISEAATYRAANAGQIPALKVGNRILVLREPFMRLLKGQAQLGTAA